MKQGDLVSRKSYDGDIIFRIVYLHENEAILKGIDFRLLADAPILDLQLIEQNESEQRQRREYAQVRELVSTWRKNNKKGTKNKLNVNLRGSEKEGKHFFDVPGKVLHLDGDRSYLQKSMNLYQELNVPVDGFYVREEDMPQVVSQLLPQVKPDILVITGHDGMLKQKKDIYSLRSYKNSHHFVQAVRNARLFERNRDALTVIAGACQSHFEALLQAGANFASSPGRVLIHALDPLYIAAKASYTPIKHTLNIGEVITQTFSGIQGIGGIETQGSYRMGLPQLQSFVKKKTTVENQSQSS